MTRLDRRWKYGLQDPQQLCYFNPAIDVLHIGDLNPWEKEDLDDIQGLSQVKTLIFTFQPVPIVTPAIGWPEYIAYFLSFFPNLEHFICTFGYRNELPWDINTAELINHPAAENVLRPDPRVWKTPDNRWSPAFRVHKALEASLEILKNESPPIPTSGFALKDARENERSYLVHYVVEKKQVREASVTK